MSAVVHHTLLGLSLAALWAAGIRVASATGARGLERALAAATLAAAAAVVQAFVLGLVGLGTSPAALTATAAATWLAARAVRPSGGPGPAAELGHAWGELAAGGRLIAGALIGAAAALTAWLLRYPSLGFDASVYHYAEVAAWMHNGSPGSIVPINHAFPVGNYPLTGEVLLAWAAGISRSFVPLSLWPPAASLLLAGGGWLGLRRLRVPRAAAALALAAVVSSPWLVRELNEPLTDLASLAWLAACAGLCAASLDRPALLGPALVAAGLAVGTKTTAAIPAVAAVGLALAASRPALGRIRMVLAGGLALALACGGVWYVRNLLQHGSPTWPFLALPWGDPQPPFIRLLDVSFIERPWATLAGRTSEYASFIAGGLVLIAGGLAAPLLRPRRGPALAGAVTGVSLLAWMLAPVTGLTRSPLVTPSDVWALSTSRYLLPVIACGAVALAVVARAPGPRAVAAMATLGVALAWNLVEDARLGLPYLPSLATPLLGAIAGAVAAWAISWVAPRVPGTVPRVQRRLGPAALAAAASALLALPAAGYVERHARFDSSRALAGRTLAAFFVDQPGFAGEGRRISTVGRLLSAELAGDRFQHELELMPPDTSCAALARRARSDWVVILKPRVARGVFGVEPIPAARCRPLPRPAYDDGLIRVYSAAP